MSAPFDLRAVEARLHASQEPDEARRVWLETRGDAVALLAHCRALREALQRLNDAKHGSSTHDDVMETIAAHRNADAVLAQAVDAEPAPRAAGDR